MSRYLSRPHLVRAAFVAVMALVIVLLLLRQDAQVRSAVSASASPISGKCTGQQQGVIKGDSTIKGREGTYSISALNHQIVSPRDPASGQATGKRQHKPMVLTMELGRATPAFLNALSNSETLTKCTFNFWRSGSNGKDTNYFRVVLTNAQVSDYSLSGRTGQDNVSFTLTYQKIEWTYLDGGITASDDWESPVTR